MREIGTTCCIAGGGPAGMMLGFLLARAGVDVTVLEKHADFLRDFRGDTIHPSTMQLMQELGLLDDFLKLPHTKERSIVARFGDQDVPIADFSHLPVEAPYIAFMPQWDFLDFLADRGKELPHFKLLMQAKATGLIRSGGRVAAVTAETAEGEMTIWADLVVAADVFVYLGELAPCFAQSARVLEPDGLLAFTVQSHDGEGVVVGDDRRFAHAEGWLRERLIEAGLTPVLVEPASTRQDRGAPVPGLLVVAEKR